MSKFSLVFLSLTLLGSTAFSQPDVKKEKKKSTGLYTKVKAKGLFSVNRELRIGKFINEGLSLYHYRKMKINDEVAKKSFKEFIKKLDYSKQFLLKDDIEKLRKFELQMDDNIKNGYYPMIDLAMGIKNERVREADKLREKLFKKQFDFSKNEEVELDPKKRKQPTTKNQFEEGWRKTFKHSTLLRYASILEDQEVLKKGKAKSKEDKEKIKKMKSKKILSKKEALVKAHEEASKKYKRYFERELQSDRMDYLDMFYNSITEVFDPHTNYMAPKKKEDFDIDMSGSLEGIGAVLQEDDGYIKVVKIVPGGAAWRQKELEAEDLILAVGEGDKDPVDIVGMRVDDAVRYIRGKKDTTVKLHVKKTSGIRKTIPIVRDVVKLGESFARSSVLELKGLKMKVGYVHLPKFYSNCTKDVRDELRRVSAQNVDGVIVDLRNNGGGSLPDAQNMSGLFIKKGPIVQVKNYNNEINMLEDTNPSIEYNGPVIVLMNRFSASASEILAGALQDYKRAVIVGGEHSHGKGTVQAVLEFDRNGLARFTGQKYGALKVTVQKFYRVNGDSTQYKGITPDIIIPDQYSYIENREQDLENSLPWDKVAAAKYKKWNAIKYDIKGLKKLSAKRVKKDKRLKKIQENIDYLSKRKDDTVATLNLSKWQKEEEENKAMIEKLKMDEENKNLVVSHFEESLKSHETVKKGEEKQWAKDFKQRKDEWVEKLRKDAGLEEAMHIMANILEGSLKKVVYQK